VAEVASFRLSGWQAAVVAVGILAWTAWGFIKHLQPVPAPAQEAMHAWLVDDYTTPDVHHHLGLTSGASSGEGATIVVRGLDTSTSPPDSAAVTLESVDGHGWKDFVIARAELSVRMPDQQVVHAERYLSVSHGVNGRWTVSGESSAWNYWDALVPAPRNGSSWP
jgi:hypothetical protein